MIAVSFHTHSSVRFPHAGKQLLFAILGLADLTLTWVLIQQGRGQVYEANPLAAWCLRNHGWSGLVVFKAVMLLCGAGVAAVISRRRPGTGGRLLALGCVATASVVGYSSYLTVACAGPFDELRIAHEDGARLGVQLAQRRKMSLLLDRLADDVVNNRCTLAEALAELEAPARARIGWLEAMRFTYPKCSIRECLAICLMLRSMDSCNNEKETRAVALRMAAAYRSLFGVAPPEIAGYDGVHLAV
jgi:hypothetical protein